MNKGGISAIVATVLVILITVAGVAIIWVGVLPMISESFVFGELDGRVSIVSAGGYTAYDPSRGIASVQIKRDIDEGVMGRIKVSFLIGGDSVSSNVMAPAPGGIRVYSFDLSGYGKPDGVEVSPIFVKGNSEKVGSVTSKVDLSSGKMTSVRGNVYRMGEDYVSDVPTDGLISMWSFSGGVEDGWGENDGSLEGGAEIVDGELVMNVAGDRDDLGDAIDDALVGLGAMSFSTWVRMTSFVNNAGIIGLGDGGGRQCWLYSLSTADTIKWTMHTSSGMREVETGTLNVGEWYYLAGTYDGSAMILYVNGVPLTPVSQTGIVPAGSDNNYLGYMQSFFYFDGSIDNVMIYNRALSEEEVIVINEIQSKE
jgi:hypothetical protein